MKSLAVLLGGVLILESYARYIKSEKPSPEVILSPRPVFSGSIPEQWDWRNVGGRSFVSNVLTQQMPNVCGSCWAEAATGSLSDRFRIATNGTLQVNLAVQTLMNFPRKLTGGGCDGGDDYEANHFIRRFGIADDTCVPFEGVDHYPEDSAAWKDTEAVQKHLCRICHWNGNCMWKHDYHRYTVDEVGRVKGEQAMMAEIYARGPISCSLDSNPDAFNNYKGGIITSAMLPEPSTDVDHSIVIAGFGVDPTTGIKFWVGRNSYGTHWGEGRGGGWFRLQRGNNTLELENHECAFAVPAAEDVKRVMNEYHPPDSLHST